MAAELAVSGPLVALLLQVPVLLLGGIYVAAVLDRLVGSAVARRPLALARALRTPLADAALLLLQRRGDTERPDAALRGLSPALLGGLAAAVLVGIPAHAAATLGDIPSGVVYLGAAMALVMVAVYLHGWSANSVLPMVGGYRFVALALSYEMPLALVLIAAALPAESLSVGDIVRSQAKAWNVVRQPLGLPLYLVAGLGVGSWGPLEQADAADLAGGTAVEEAGASLLLWRVARLAMLVAVATTGAAVFLGGWLGPWLPGPVWLVAKTLALLVVLLASGHLIARVRLERFVVFAWAVLIPLALADVFASGLLALTGLGR